MKAGSAAARASVVQAFFRTRTRLDRVGQGPHTAAISSLLARLGSPGLNSEAEFQFFTTAQQLAGKTFKWVPGTVILERHFAEGAWALKGMKGQGLGERREDP